MVVAKQIANIIRSIPKGEPFISARFLSLGPRATVDQTLYRLAKAGEIIRVARGMYARPKMNPLVGAVRPGPGAIVELIAQLTGETITATPAEAERVMGLTTQMQMRPTFATSGRSRRIKSGAAEIVLRHTCHRKLMLATKPAWLAMLALWNCGRANLTQQEIQTVMSRLEASEAKELKNLIPMLPTWLAEKILHFNEGANVWCLFPHVAWPKATVNVLSPRRTFWEKVTLIHVECNRPEAVDSDRKFRHWFDLVKLADSACGNESAADLDMLRAVVAHKEIFYNAGYANYRACLAGGIRLVPPAEILKRLRSDWQKMTSEGMFFDTPPHFDAIMDRIQAIETALNEGTMRGRKN